MLKYILRKNCSAVAFLLLMILTLGQVQLWVTWLSGRSSNMDTDEDVSVLDEQPERRQSWLLPKDHQ